MNRALKNKTRGKQAGPLPPKPTPSPAQNIQSYDGRANLAAGKFDVKTEMGVTAEGQTVSWTGVENPK